MGLLNTLKQIKEEGFDPRKDAISKSARLEAGNYPVRIKEVERTVNEKTSREQMIVKLEVVSGEAAGKFESIYLGFDDDLPDFVLEKNGRILLKLAEFAGVTFKKGELDDLESTTEALQRGIGKQFLLKLTITPNKKTPEYPYRNHDFDELSDGLEDVEDDDLPF